MKIECKKIYDKKGRWVGFVKKQTMTIEEFRKEYGILNPIFIASTKKIKLKMIAPGRIIPLEKAKFKEIKFKKGKDCYRCGISKKDAKRFTRIDGCIDKYKNHMWS